MNVNIVGWYGRKNVGDEAFRGFFAEAFFGHNVRFVTPPDVVGSPDVVVLGGGAVVSPFYLKALRDSHAPRHAVGIDLAYESEVDLIAKADFLSVYARNATDVAALKAKLTCPVGACPDLAFYYRPTGVDVLGKYKAHPPMPTVGVFVTDYVNPAIDRPIDKFGPRSWDFKIQMARELDLLSDMGYEVLLVPCSTGGYGDDRRINLDLAAFMKSRPTLVMDTLSPQDMIDLMSGLDGAVCMRFHAHIFAMIAGTPFVSINFTRKVKLMLEEHGIDIPKFGFENEQFACGGLAESVEGAKTNFDHAAVKRAVESHHVHIQELLVKVRKGCLGECK